MHVNFSQKQPSLVKKLAYAIACRRRHIGRIALKFNATTGSLHQAAAPNGVRTLSLFSTYRQYQYYDIQKGTTKFISRSKFCCNFGVLASYITHSQQFWPIGSKYGALA